MPFSVNDKILLVGGGVGVAPMLYWGAQLKAKGFTPQFLIGARSAKDVLQLEEFEKIGKVYKVILSLYTFKNLVAVYILISS